MDGRQTHRRLDSVGLKHLQKGRDENRYVVAGRLKPDVTHSAGQAEMTAISERLVRAYPDIDPGRASPRPPAPGDGRSPVGRLWMLLGSSALVFFIVCANVAGLFVARAVRRQTEMAIARASARAVAASCASLRSSTCRCASSAGSRALRWRSERRACFGR